MIVLLIKSEYWKDLEKNYSFLEKEIVRSLACSTGGVSFIGLVLTGRIIFKTFFLGAVL